LPCRRQVRRRARQPQTMTDQAGVDIGSE
jgi:hypothetical protein